MAPGWDVRCRTTVTVMGWCLQYPGRPPRHAVQRTAPARRRRTSPVTARQIAELENVPAGLIEIRLRCAGGTGSRHQKYSSAGWPVRESGTGSRIRR